MGHANIHDLASVERIYSREVFHQDAGDNARDKATTHHGLKILSSPDDRGDFRLARASQHVGENDPEGDSVFLVPQLRESSHALSDETYAGSLAPAEAPGRAARDEGEYGAFIAGVVEAAKEAHFKLPIGLGEERLVGFRGG